MEAILNFVANERNATCRLDVFLSEKLQNTTRSQIKNLIDNEKALVNNKKVKSGYSLKNGDVITVEMQVLPKFEGIQPENISLDIVYEDEYLAVINKPKNMVVHPAGTLVSGTLVNALLYHFSSLSQVNGNFRPGIVHRLDKDTSGLIVVAKNDEAHLNLQNQIQTKTCKRIYRAVCYGKFNCDTGTITTYLARGKHQHEKIFVVPEGQGRLAITNYKVLNYYNGYSYVEFELKTGRTHQIRVHCAHLNHPIVGDKTYGKKGEKNAPESQLLHAVNLQFVHPKTQKELSFSSELPQEFKDFLTDKKLV